jgi:hypothetical protein
MIQNIKEQRISGASLGRIRDTIRFNLQQSRGSRLGNYAYNASRYNERRERMREAGRLLCEAIRDESDSDAISVLRDFNGELGGHTEWVEWLEDKFGGDYFTCYDCDEIGYYEDSNNVEDDFRVCDCCSDNYYYSERRGYLCRDSDDDYDDEDNDGYSNIGSYHSSKRRLGHIPSSYDNRKPRVLLGLELEMEINDSYDLDSKAGQVLDSIGRYHSPITKTDYQYCLMEQDGSISNGFEMVTGYSGLDVHAAQLAFFKDRFVGAKSHNTTTCGLHIHVCKSDMTLLHAAKMILFINDEKNLDLVTAVARRGASSYAKFKDKKGDKYWLKDALGSSNWKADRLRRINSDRYEALNFQNANTVEFRLFKGTLKYTTIMACLEFAYATWFFARDTSQTQLTSENFLKFICLENNRRDTAYLRAYLVEKGFVLPFATKPRPVAYGGSLTTSTTGEL